MCSPPTPSPSVPYDDIYDPACDLVEATARMRRAAATLQDAQLAPALVNCIEAALHDLAWTAAALEKTSVRLTTEHRSGPADPRGPVLLAEIAEQQAAQLVVTGSRGRSAPVSTLLGSVASRLAAVTTRPCLIVPPTALSQGG